MSTVELIEQWLEKCGEMCVRNLLLMVAEGSFAALSRLTASARFSLIISCPKTIGTIRLRDSCFVSPSSPPEIIT